MGHVILYINFKGTRTGSGQEIMPYISRKLMKLFSSIKFYSYRDLFEIVFTDCAMNVDESNFTILVKWIATHYDIILSIVTTVATTLLTIITVLRRYVSFTCSLILILFTIFLFAIPLYFLWYNRIPLIEYMRPINHTITSGDWETLVCYLNKLAKLKPENRPILLI